MCDDGSSAHLASGLSAGGSAVLAEDAEDLFEHAPCGYLSITADSRIFRANFTLASWIGLPRDELLGKRIHDLLNIAGCIYYETHFAPLLRMQGFFNEVALDLRTKGKGDLPVLVNAVERRDEAGEVQFIRLTIFNASDRRRYEKELLQARREAELASLKLRELNVELEARVTEEVAQRMKAEDALRQSQKMEAIGQLTGGVAHDFNNLLTIVIGGLDMIGRELDKDANGVDPARLRRARDMAHDGARRAATLTARLLAFSRRQALAPTVVEPNRLITGIAELLQRTLGETVALETVTAAGLWRAFADRGELENALINLAVNARDAMPGGGRLTIETGNTFLDEAYVGSLAEPVAAGQYVLVAVSDTGQGMSADTLARVFEPFFTTKEVGKGTGLGLSQVYGFIRQTGGHVRIYSELGQGTTVKLYLPRAKEGAVESEPRTSFKGETDGGIETILVVEDDEHLRSYSSGILRDLGYNVMEAGTGRAALALIETAADLNLLFTDIVLPEGMNGRVLADEARKRKSGLKVLFTTGYTRNAIVHNGILDPDVELLGKPFTFNELTAKVRALLDRT